MNNVVIKWLTVAIPSVMLSFSVLAHTGEDDDCDTRNNTVVEYDSKDMTLLSQLNFGCDIVGDLTVSADGKTIYLGSATEGKGVRIIDVSDTANPVVVNEIAVFPGGLPEDVEVLDVQTDYFKGRLLVTGVGGTSNGLDIWDVTDMHHPVHKAFFDVAALYATSGPLGIHQVNIVQRQNPLTRKQQVIVAASDPFGNIFRGLFAPQFQNVGEAMFIDVTDPSNPMLAGSWSTNFSGLPAGSSTFIPLPPPYDCSASDPSKDPYGRATGCRGFDSRVGIHDVQVNAKGTLAFASAWDLGAIILDISDLANIKVLAIADNLNNPSGNIHSIVLNETENLMIVNREDARDPKLTGAPEYGTSEIWNIKDPEHPMLLSAIFPPTSPSQVRGIAGSPFHNAIIRGDRLYESAYAGGIRVYDISDPSLPQEIAFYEVEWNLPTTSLFDGVWGVVFHGDKVYGSHMTGGFMALQLNK